MSVRTIVKSIQDIMRQDTGVDGDAQRISQLCWMFFLKIIDDQDQELELLNAEYRSPIPKKYQWRAWAADPEGITGEELIPHLIDQNSCAHWRSPMDMIFQGRSTSVFQA
jgi:type I restriction enzyme M protein